MYIQLPQIKGNPQRSKDNQNMLSDDFYTLCMKNPNYNIGLRKYTPKDENSILKINDTSVEYLCSDFVRFCLCLYKNSTNISRKEMTIIPKQPIPISEELKKYMEEFLPDYYDIRTNRK